MSEVRIVGCKFLKTTNKTRFSCFIETDKSKYKPGETCRIRVFFLNTFTHQPVSNNLFKNVNVLANIKSSDGTVVFGGLLPKNENSMINFEWKIPQNQVGGQYSIEIFPNKGVLVEESDLMKVDVKSLNKFGKMEMKEVDGNIVIKKENRYGIDGWNDYVQIPLNKSKKVVSLLFRIDKTNADVSGFFIGLGSAEFMAKEIWKLASANVKAGFILNKQSQDNPKGYIIQDCLYKFVIDFEKDQMEVFKDGVLYGRNIKKPSSFKTPVLMVVPYYSRNECTLYSELVKSFFPNATRKIDVETSRMGGKKFIMDLFFARKGYGSNEKVKAVLSVKRSDNAIPQKAKVRVTARVDGKEIFKKNYDVNKMDGTCLISFTLPKVILNGEGTLNCAVTEGFTENISKTIPIILKKLDCIFYGESGDIVSGVENGVYFQAKTSEGNPCDFEGILVSSKGLFKGKKEVRRIKTVHEGRGYFRFKHEKGKKYFIEVVKPIGIDPIELHVTSKTGVSLLLEKNIAHEFGKEISVGICSNIKKKLFVSLFRKEKVLFTSKEFKSKSGKKIIIKLDPKNTSGVLRVTVFTKDNLPICERLVFVLPKDMIDFEVATDKESYLPGDKVKVTIRTKLKINQTPLPAFLGVSVTDDSVLKMVEKRKRAPNLIEGHFLEEEVKELEDCSTYFNPNFEKGEQRVDSIIAIDLLLGVQGWRRFIYNLYQHKGENDISEIIKTSNDSSKPLVTKEMVLRMLNSYEVSIKNKKVFATDNAILKNEHFRKEEFSPKVDPEVIEDEPKEKKKGFFSWMFGKKKKTPKNSLDTLALLQKRIDLLNVKIGREVEKVKGFLKNNNKTAARNCLVRKKAFEKQIIRLNQQIVNIEDMNKKLDESSMSHDMFKAQKSGVKQLQKKMGGIDQIEDTMDDIRDAMQDADELGDALSLSIGAMDEDDGDIMDELELLELEDEMGDELMDSSQVKISQKVVQSKTGRLTDKFTSFKTKVKTKEDRELEELEQLLLDGDSPNTKTPKHPSKKIIQFIRVYSHVKHPKKREDLRNDFTENLYFGNVETKKKDNRCETSFEFDLNDSVSSFCVNINSFSKEGYLGSSNLFHITSRKSFYLDTKIPLEISFRDQVKLPLTVVNNLSKKLTCLYKVTPSNCKLIEVMENEGSFEVKKMERKSKYINLKVKNPSIVNENNSVVIEGNVKELQISDKISRKITVKPYGFPHFISFSGSLKNGEVKEFNFELPKDLVEHSIEVLAYVTPSSLSQLSASLSGLIRIPYGCFEQVSSSMYPMILAANFFQEKDVKMDKNFVDKIEKSLDSGYKKLVNYEIKETGGFDWYGRPPANESLSALGLAMFVELKKIFPVDKKVIDRTVQFLLKKRTKTGFAMGEGRYAYGKANQDITTAYILWCISQASVFSSSIQYNDVKMIMNSMLNKVNKWGKALFDCYIVSLLSLAFWNFKKKKEARKLVERIPEFQNADGSVTKAFSTITRSGGRNLILETTALSSMALMNFFDDYKECVGKMVRFIMGNERYGRFGSTQGTSLCLQAITIWSSVVLNGVAGNVSLKVNGEFESTKKCSEEILNEIKFDDFSMYLGGVKNKLVLENNSKMELPFSINVCCRKEKPPTNLEDLPFVFSNKLLNEKLKEGDTTEIEICLINKEEKELPMILVMCSLPGGLDVNTSRLKELQKMEKFAYYELWGARNVVFYFRFLQKKEKISFKFNVNAAVPGSFFGDPSKCYLYYNDDIIYYVKSLSCDIIPKEKEHYQ